MAHDWVGVQALGKFGDVLVVHLHILSQLLHLKFAEVVPLPSRDRFVPHVEPLPDIALEFVLGERVLERIERGLAIADSESSLPLCEGLCLLGDSLQLLAHLLQLLKDHLGVYFRVHEIARVQRRQDAEQIIGKGGDRFFKRVDPFWLLVVHCCDCSLEHLVEVLFGVLEVVALHLVSRGDLEVGEVFLQQVVHLRHRTRLCGEAF
mmetsp:Transcript_14318/g.36344  ORF Transcript_14318/g.36344 Transcript_14318/m.36344 type:complete len:206 (-) Transcript_14318:2140-2757(-)